MTKEKMADRMEKLCERIESVRVEARYAVEDAIYNYSRYDRS
nr:hypothetical protein [Candidatus Liberibacter solanacearum]